MQPETRYARLGEDGIAYQVVGEGPPDLVMTTGNYSHVDMVWEDPGIALFLRMLALGSDQGALLAQLDASPMALFFAGTRPERTRALILVNAATKFLADDDYPIGVPAAVAEALLAQFDQLWGPRPWPPCSPPAAPATRASVAGSPGSSAPSPAPGVVQAFLRASLEMDARPILPLIQAPTLVLHRQDYQFIPIANGRYLAERIPGAALVELSGTEQSLFWETPETALDHIERFLTGVRRVAQPTRVLATVLFTDIVGSTRRAGELGDRRWRELLNVHDELTGRLVEEFGGRLVKTTGDGVLATFDGPGRAIQCAVALREELAGIGAQARRDPGVQDRAGPGCRRRRHH